MGLHTKIAVDPHQYIQLQLRTCFGNKKLMRQQVVTTLNPQKAAGLDQWQFYTETIGRDIMRLET